MSGFTAKRLQIALLVALTTVGCAFGEIRPNDPLQRQVAMEDTMRRYTNLVRWNSFPEASRFVHPDLRDTYVEKAPSEELRFTDYEIPPVDISDDLRHSTVKVKYKAFDRSSLYEYEIVETQVWEREEGSKWTVRPSFENLPADVAAQ